MKFRVKVVEAISKSFEVESPTEGEALALVLKKHRDGEIVVESDSGADVDFLIQPMTEYSIGITETLKKTVMVEAVTADEAVRLIEVRYKDGEVTLDRSDFIGVNFVVYP
jgi:hypothetical protein